MELDAELVGQLKRVLAAAEYLLPKPLPSIDWSVCHAANWKRHSFAGYLDPIESVEGITLEDLLGIEKQKKAVEDNTRQFLAGLPANNALLWGTRGAGRRPSSGRRKKGIEAAASRTSSPATGWGSTCCRNRGFEGEKKTKVMAAPLPGAAP